MFIRRDALMCVNIMETLQVMDNKLSVESVKSQQGAGGMSNQRQFGWSAMQRADDPDVNRANKQLKQDIANGANGVAIVFAGAHNAYGFGLPPEPDTIEKLFDGVALDGLHLRLENHSHGRPITDTFITYLQKSRIDLNRTQITFGTDPTASLATTGRLKMSIAALKASLPQSMSAFFSSGLPGVVLEADGRPYHNAGATEAQEIGAMLSVAVSHLKMIEDGRHHILYALPHIGFATSLDQDPVLGKAKLRALRLLWHRIQKGLGVENPFPAIIHVETSMRMMSAHDPLLNVSRCNLASYAAISSGVVSLNVLPFSMPLGLADSFARRQALLSQLILAEENAATSVFDASENSENSASADMLVDAAWEEYQRFERAGGILETLIDGSLELRFEEARDLRTTAFLKGERTILGVTKARLQNELPVCGIYDQKPSQFVADGIVHCKPLTFKRLETCYEEAAAIAPAGAALVV